MNVFKIKQNLAAQFGGPDVWSVPRLALDFAALALVAVLNARVPTAWMACLTVILVGAIPLHDILVHGHEATHRLITRSRVVNDGCLWLTHALLFLSGRSYCAFHLEHHARTGRLDDPEKVFYSGGRGEPDAGDYWRIPFLSHWLINTWPWRHSTHQVTRMEVVRDLAGAALLHGALLLSLGLRGYLLLLVLPMATSLSFVFTLRSLCEHLGCNPNNPWTRTRAMVTHPVTDFLWSNVSHHLEHHLYPAVPFNRLPALRRALRDEYRREGSVVDAGYLRTAARLAMHPAPRTLVSPRSVAFRFKVRWFKDILSNDATRHHLWSLYYAGEAYEGTARRRYAGPQATRAGEEAVAAPDA